MHAVLLNRGPVRAKRGEVGVPKAIALSRCGGNLRCEVADDLLALLLANVVIDGRGQKRRPFQGEGNPA